MFCGLKCHFENCEYSTKRKSDLIKHLKTHNKKIVINSHPIFFCTKNI